MIAKVCSTWASSAEEIRPNFLGLPGSADAIHRAVNTAHAFLDAFIARWFIERKVLITQEFYESNEVKQVLFILSATFHSSS